MVRHFFLDKTNTIIENSLKNMGLNPVLHIGYGNRIMRGLIHFDECQIKELIEDKTFANVDKLKFTLKMTNYFSLDSVPYEKTLVQSFNSPTKRAASFDLILFKLPMDFDEGRGFDFVSDFWVRNRASFSREGSNWYFCKSNIPWNYEDETDKTAEELVMPDIFDKSEFIHIYKKLMDYSEKMNDQSLSGDNVTLCAEIVDDIKNIKTNYKFDEKSLKGGIYSYETLVDEYEKFLNGEESLVVAEQHFDFGDEGLSMDITDYVLDVVKNGDNFGLCLAFAPRFENTTTDVEQYVGFVDDNTNTFFHPYVEAEYSEYVDDDRESFTIGADNKLYLYVYDDGEAVNLDKVPVCTIEGEEFEVKQVGKGVYCALIPKDSLSLEAGAIYYDTWSEIELNGNSEDDVELEFSTRPRSKKISMTADSNTKQNLVPSLYGINDGEGITQEEIREVVVDFRKEFETEKRYLVDSADFRLYVKDGNREVDVIKYQPVEKGFLNNYFLIYGMDLIPNTYYVDIRVKLGREIKHFRNSLTFKVVSNVTERYS